MISMFQSFRKVYWDIIWHDTDIISPHCSTVSCPALVHCGISWVHWVSMTLHSEHSVISDIASVTKHRCGLCLWLGYFYSFYFRPTVVDFGQQVADTDRLYPTAAWKILHFHCSKIIIKYPQPLELHFKDIYLSESSLKVHFFQNTSECFLLEGQRTSINLKGSVQIKNNNANSEGKWRTTS